MGKLIAITVKELKILMKDPGGLLLLFILPAMFILVLSVALQGAFSSPDSDEKIEVLVVNRDTGDFGKKLIEAVDRNGHFRTVTGEGGRPLTPERAEALVKAGTYPIAVLVPDGMTGSLFFKSKNEIELIADPTFSKPATWGLKGAIKELVHVSMLAGKITEAQKKGEAIDLLKENIEDIKTQCDKCKTQLEALSNPRKLMAVLRSRSRIRAAKEGKSQAETTVEEPDIDALIAEGKNDKDAENTVALIQDKGVTITHRFAYGAGADEDIDPNSVQQNVPGWTIFALFWIAQILCINILHERQTGAFKRVMVAPISFARYMLAKTVPFFIINMIQALLMFALGIYVLPHVGCPQLVIQNVPALVLLTVAISVTAIGFGIMMASLSKTVFLSASVSASVLIIMTAIGGIMVPRFVMPESMQRLSLFVPHGWALEGYLNVLVKGQTLEEILPHVGALLLFGCGFVLFAILRLHRLNRV